MTADARSMYLDLLKRTLTRYDMGAFRHPILPSKPAMSKAVAVLSAALDPLHLQLVRIEPFDPLAREEGRDTPLDADTMVGLKRLDNLQQCVTTIIDENIPGDLLEAGVWRGGAAIFMRAILKVADVEDRVVWAADSFSGLPRPDPSIDADRGDTHYRREYLAVGLDEVKANFAKYGLLDDQVKFLKGWFSDTLPTAPIDSLALLRADGDLYASTMDILKPLYPKVVPGGFVVIDDYGAIPACRQAVDDFRDAHGIRGDLTPIDWTGVYWRKAQR